MGRNRITITMDGIIHNVYGHHFDISSRFLMFVICGAIALEVLTIIALLIIRKVKPQVRMDISLKKKWRYALVTMVCLIVVEVLILW